MKSAEAVLVIQNAFTDGSLIRATLSRKRVSVAEFPRITIRPIILKGQLAHQFEYCNGSKATHRNLSPADAASEVIHLFESEMDQARILTRDAEYHLCRAADGGITARETRLARVGSALDHNRRKSYLIEEGKPCPFLARLGVMTPDGRVVHNRHDKFRQVNRFLEMVDDVSDRLNHPGPVRVVDFGSGKSYLTFALHYYLAELRGLDVRITGLDRNKEIVDHCCKIASDLNLSNLRFEAGEIAGFTGLDTIDMVVSLHACDTATDDALAKAVQWGARVILAVPCCQHELYAQIAAESQQALLRHGILKERVAAILTDALRAQALEIMGYSVQVMEFIETAHTPKNLLIRAVKRESAFQVRKKVQEYIALRDSWGVRPKIEVAMGESFQRFIRAAGHASGRAST